MPKIEAYEDDSTKIAGSINLTTMDWDIRIKSQKKASRVELLGAGAVSLSSSDSTIEVNSAGEIALTANKGGVIHLTTNSDGKISEFVLADDFMSILMTNGLIVSELQFDDKSAKLSYGQGATGSSVELKADSITLKSGTASLTIGSSGIVAKINASSIDMSATGIKLEGGPTVSLELAAANGVQIKVAENALNITPASAEIKAAIIQTSADGISSTKGPIAGTKADGVLQQSGSIVMIGQ